ncbi:MAG: 4-hydroxy-tetrahydrodipicolinate synthase [Alphaproteobacteria bacterium]
MFHGSMVALITPFQNGQVDEAAIADLVEWHIAEGTKGIIPCGSTGESLLLSWEEQQRVIEMCINTAAGRVKIIPGAAAIEPGETIRRAQFAKDKGADGVLIVTPPYVKPTQEGLYDYYKRVNDAVDIPILVYNNPGRASIEIAVETVGRLSKLKNIAGIKDSSTDMPRVQQIRAVTDPDFAVISGEDPTCAAYLAQGGQGCISVLANVAPRLCSDLNEAWLRGDMKAFNAARDALFPLNQAMFLETNPMPIKYAVSLLGKCQNELRTPLSTVNDNTQQRVQQAMKTAGVL